MQAMTFPSSLNNASRNLVLSNLALDAAIEIDEFKSTGSGSFAALMQLGKALTESTISDLTMVPMYDLALAAGATRPTSKADLYGRLHEIAAKMNEPASESKNDLTTIRDFCLALHDALLNARIENLHRPIANEH